MSWSARRAIAVLGGMAVLGTLASLQLSWAQEELPVFAQKRRPPIIQPDDPMGPVKPPRAGDATDLFGINLPTDDNLKGKIEDINVFIEVGDWEKAIDRLQALLDRTDDVFAQVTRGKGSAKSQHLVNVRAEASRIVGNLPEGGLQFYRLMHGPKAAEDLKIAKADGDKKLLGDIMKRYLYTEAGADATELLATQLLDRGEFAAAAGCFEKLFQRSGPTKLAPLTLFKAALAFHVAGGDNKTNLDNAWKHLEGKLDGRPLDLGTRQVAVADLREFVIKRKSLSTNPERYDWVMGGGHVSRAAQGDGGTAFIHPNWKEATITEAQTKSWFKQTTDHLDSLKLPHLHGFSPLAVTVSRDGVKVPLFIYRSSWGLHARAVKELPKEDPPVKKGEIYWEAPSAWSVDRMVREPRVVGQLNSWMQTYIGSKVRPQIIMENSVYGSLSSDSHRVYLIEDFQVPPYSQQAVNRFGQPGPVGPGGPVGDAINHNRLQAFDLDSGKLQWEVGDTNKGELSNSFFLSPPLPLNGKLLVLNEKDQELRLVTLDPSNNGQLVHKPQRLADLRDPITKDVSRRFHAAHLAYGEGVLVCPTNSGGILGVDLLTNSLIWAYGYRDKNQAAEVPQQPGVPPGMVMLPDGRMVPQVQNANGWRVSPPIITEGKVVFTAPDSNSVTCLNLRDGSRIWKQTRKEGDLYLAGVFAGKALVVGKSYARAINLADGTEAWNLETGLPSGFGIASKDVYYLPLAQSLKTREPGIALLDMNNGRVHAFTRARPRTVEGKSEIEVPGNLLFYEGEVLSQSATHVAAYPQLDVELKTIDALLAKNDKDPEGRTRRGDLRLDKGDLGGAIDDLRTALASAAELKSAGKPVPEGLEGKAKGKLFESLTEYFQRDFDKAEKYLKDYEAMCSVVTPGMPAEEKKAAVAEEKRRKGNYWCLVGRGRESQKKLKDAFEAYMNFGTLGSVDNEMMSVVDDPGVKASPMVWAQGRIAAMVAKATREELAPLEQLVTERWEKLKGSTDLDALRGFVSTFGSISAVGREARLQLAERLILDNDDKALVDAERHLSILRMQRDDTAMAARSVEAMARLMTRKGLMEDAAFFYRVLSRDHGKDIVKDGKTGQDFYNDLATDKRFLPYLDEPVTAFSGKVRPTEEAGSFPHPGNLFQLEQEGEALPFFQSGFKLVVRSDYNQLKLVNRETGEEVWSYNLEGTNFQQLAQHNFNPGISGQQRRFGFRNLGHFVLLQVGNMVFAIDPVSKKELWKSNLAGTGQPGLQSVVIDPRDGSMQVVYQVGGTGWMLRLGQMGSLSPVAVCLLASDSLTGVDPITGKVLWTRNDMAKSGHLYSDDQYIYTVEVSGDGTLGATRIFRLHDGVAVPAKDFSDLYGKRLKMFGRTLLSSDADGRNVTVRLYDVVTGKDLWKSTFAAGSYVLHPEQDGLAGAVEPNGKVTIVDLKTLKVICKDAQIRPEHLAKIKSLHVLRDARDVYVLCHGQPEELVDAGSLVPNLMPNVGLRSLAVNGQIYSFKADSGELNWFNNAENQSLVLDEFEKIPAVLLTSRYRRWTDKGRAQQMYVAALRSYDKQTGKLIFDREDPNTSKYQQFHSIKVDARGGYVDLISYNLRWRHALEGVKGGDGGKPGDGRQGRGPGGAPVEEFTVPPLPPGVLPPPPPVIRRKIIKD